MKQSYGIRKFVPFQPDRDIGETAHLLGFEFPHHFTRLFKKTTGITPSEFLGKTS